MAQQQPSVNLTPCLRSFLDSLKTTTAENSADQLVSYVYISPSSLWFPAPLTLFLSLFLSRAQVYSSAAKSHIHMLLRSPPSISYEQPSPHTGLLPPSGYSTASRELVSSYVILYPER